MELNELETAATAVELGAVVQLYQDDLHRLHHTHESGSGSVREVNYKEPISS